MAARIAIMAAALLLAAVGFVAVAVFLCMALYGAFIELALRPAMAALASAGVLLLISVLIIVIGSAIAKAVARGAKRAKAGGTPAAQLGGELGRLLGESAFNFITANPARVLIGALIAGFAVGASPKIRSFLQNLLRR